MKLMFEGLILLLFSFSVFALAEPNTDAPSLKLASGDQIEIHVKDLVPYVIQQDTETNFGCQNGLSFQVKVDEKRKFYIHCFIAGGGLLKLSASPGALKKGALQIAEDGGDEGCLKTISSVLTHSKNGQIKISIKTTRSGQLAGGTPASCGPGQSMTDYVWDPKTKKFK